MSVTRSHVEIHEATANRRKRIKAAAFLAIVVGVAMLAWRFPVSDWTVELAEQIRDLGAIGVALFIAVYVIATVALLPGSLLTLVAGFAYGPLGGLLVVSPASVLAATVAFLLTRTALRDWVQKRVGVYPKARAFDAAIARDSFKLVLLLRLSPAIPFNILNYALGLSSAPVGRYIVASFIGMLPGTWMYVYVGSLATTAAGLGDTSHESGPEQLVLTLIGLAATVLVVVLVTRSAQRALKTELEKKSA